jgi:hypothetical protein
LAIITQMGDAQFTIWADNYAQAAIEMVVK